MTDSIETSEDEALPYVAPKIVIHQAEIDPMSRLGWEVVDAKINTTKLDQASIDGMDDTSDYAAKKDAA